MKVTNSANQSDTLRNLHFNPECSLSQFMWDFLRKSRIIEENDFKAWFLHVESRLIISWIIICIRFWKFWSEIHSKRWLTPRLAPLIIYTKIKSKINSLCLSVADFLSWFPFLINRCTVRFRCKIDRTRPILSDLRSLREYLRKYWRIIEWN